MSPLSDEYALIVLRDSLACHCRRSLDDCQYYWEAVESIVWRDSAILVSVLCAAEYDLIFDPNPWTMSVRLVAARHAGASDVPLGYRLTREELLYLLQQTWMIGQDFFVLDAERQFCGMRTHEDPGSQRGAWIPVIGD
jgi:hypothetical protein